MHCPDGSHSARTLALVIVVYFMKTIKEKEPNVAILLQNKEVNIKINIISLYLNIIWGKQNLN